MAFANTTPRIGQPAPQWKADAVVDGAFKEISLDDYKVRDVALVAKPNVGRFRSVEHAIGVMSRSVSLFRLPG